MMVQRLGLCMFGLFKQKTAYGVGISDLSSDVCSSDRSGRRSAIGRDLLRLLGAALLAGAVPAAAQAPKPDAELHRAWAAGYRAAFTCSSLWNGADRKSVVRERVCQSV